MNLKPIELHENNNSCLISGNGRVAFDFDAAGIDTSGANAPDTLAIDTNGLLYSTLSLSGIIVIDPWYVLLILLNVFLSLCLR